MKIIFIRHGEPDYDIDSLTEKGWREAELLAARTKDWNVTDFYCSPLGRARDTSKATLKAQNREATVLEWLREFQAPIADPVTGKSRIPWDLSSEYLNAHPELFDIHEWYHSPAMLAGNLEENYHFVTSGIDGLLDTYGYRREGYRYLTSDASKTEAVVVCFCHLGVTCAIMSHLLNMTPHQLWQGFCLAPTSVTVIGTEERTPGEAYFRCQFMGDTSHLRFSHEPVSIYASFTEPFQG